jgi:phosphatidate cytidylyltransferase
LVITVMAQLSDLAESALKRNFAVKDSGGLIPGHGGILDRFDSFILTSPIVYYIIKSFLS